MPFVKRSHKRAFSLIELLVVISVVALLIALVLPSMAKSRRAGQAVVCGVNLKSIGQLSQAYSNDFQDVLFGLSWQPRGEQTRVEDADAEVIYMLQQSQFDNAAQIAQAISLFRNIGDDPNVSFDAVANFWQPNALFGYLPLAQHAGKSIPSKDFICSADATSLRWIDKTRFEIELPSVAAVTGGDPSFVRRMRLRPSYWRTAAMWQPDIGVDPILPVAQNSFQNSNHPRFDQSQRRLDSVAFPSQKIMMFDQQDRHSGRTQMYFAELQAKQPLLFFDGSVSVRANADANRSNSPVGWRAPFPLPVQPDYLPQAALGEAPALGTYPPGSPTRPARDVRYWYTKGGLRGVDFGSSSVDTRTWQP